MELYNSFTTYVLEEESKFIGHVYKKSEKMKAKVKIKKMSPIDTDGTLIICYDPCSTSPIGPESSSKMNNNSASPRCPWERKIFSIGLRKFITAFFRFKMIFQAQLGFLSKDRNT